MTEQNTALLHDEYINRAKVIMNEATALLRQDNLSAEDREKVDKMIEDAEYLTSKSAKLKDLNAAMAAQNIGQSPSEAVQNANEDKAQEWDNLGEYFNAIVLKNKKGINDPRLTWVRGEQRIQAKDMSGNVGADGGYLAPAEFIPTILNLQAEMSIVAPRATRIPMASRQIQLPALDQGATTANVTHYFGGIRVYYTGEGQAMTETQPAFRLITLTAHDLTALVDIPDSLLADSVISIPAWLQGPMGIAGAFAHRSDYAYLRGTGSGQPLGILNAPATVSITRAGASAIAYDDLVGVLNASLPTPGRVWVAQSYMRSELMLMNGPSGNPSYLWGNAEAGQPERLLGFPIIFTEKVPDLGAEGDIGLYDFGYYAIGEREMLTFDTSNAPQWANNITSFKGVMRHDGQPWLNLPFTLMNGTDTISPFVNVAA